MLFLRRGLRIIGLETKYVNEIKDFYIQHMNGEEMNFYKAMDESVEDNTLILIVEPKEEKIKLGDAKVMLLVKNPVSNCLANIINLNISHLIDRVLIGPTCMLMRIAGEEKAVKDELIKAFHGNEMTLEEAINEGRKEDTILFLTRKPLSYSVKNKDMIKPPILIPSPSSQVYKRLSKEGLLFITRSMKDRTWLEYRINIYDSKGKYNEHYRRLNFVLAQLDIGMVIEENWTRDHALMLFSVAAYQVRIISAYPPHVLKKIVMGLEYNDNGDRWVDMDIYYRNKKISWVDIEKDRKKQSRKDEGIEHRKTMLERLSDEAKKTLFSLEKDL